MTESATIHHPSEHVYFQMNAGYQSPYTEWN
jgi:hypothetical protein